jgi:hypothetical protein
MVNMAGNSRQTSPNKMSKCNWTNELVNDLIDLVEEIEVIWNAGDRNANSIMMPFGQHKILTEEQIDKVTDFIYTL